MKEKVKQAYRRVVGVDNETPRMIALVRRACVGIAGPVILDVGCGYGRTLRALRAAGFPATGIEINPAIVERNRREGLECLLPDEFRNRRLMADVIVMSHVVEHFSPSQLLAFLNDYLSYLRPGGYLIVATPLAGDRFFDDFDHVRPYQPLGFTMVYGAGDAQVQYLGQHRLELVDLWFRRSPFGIAFARGLYVRSWTSRWLQIANLAGVGAFWISAGLVGRTTGWVGMFCKD